MDRDRRYDTSPPDVWSALGLSQTPQCREYLISCLIYLYFNCPRSTDVCQRKKAACVSVVRLLHDYHMFRWEGEKMNMETGRRPDGGRRRCGVTGPVSWLQVSLLRVLCPKTLLSPYLLPLSSTADGVCLDCRSDAPSLLSLLPHLCHSCNSSVHRDCTLPCAATM